MTYCPIPSEWCVEIKYFNKKLFHLKSIWRVPRKIVARATLGTRAIGSPALV